jgi:hypothetical protein
VFRRKSGALRRFGAIGDAGPAPSRDRGRQRSRRPGSALSAEGRRGSAASVGARTLLRAAPGDSGPKRPRCSHTAAPRGGSGSANCAARLRGTEPDRLDARATAGARGSSRTVKGRRRRRTGALLDEQKDRRTGVKRAIGRRWFPAEVSNRLTVVCGRQFNRNRVEKYFEERVQKGVKPLRRKRTEPSGALGNQSNDTRTCRSSERKSDCGAI